MRMIYLMKMYFFSYYQFNTKQQFRPILKIRTISEMFQKEFTNDYETQLKQLIFRIQEIKNIKNILIEYYVKNVETYKYSFEILNRQILNLNENISDISLTSHKCRLIRDYIQYLNYIYNQLSLQMVQKRTRLKTIPNNQRQQSELLKKYQDLIKNLKQTEQYHKNVSKMQNQHFDNCKKLALLIQKINLNTDPMVYYNGEQCERQLQQFQNQYKKCTNSESNIQTQFQMLFYKNHPFAQNMKFFVKRYITLFQKTTMDILNACNIIIQYKPFEQQKINKSQMHQYFDDQGDEQMKKYDAIYAAKQKRQIQLRQVFDYFQQIKDQNLDNSQIDFQYSLIQQRCLIALKKQKKNVEDVLNQKKFLLDNLQKQYLIINKMQQNLEKNEKITILNSNCNIKQFLNKIQSIYGQNIRIIFELSQRVIKNYKQKIKKGIIIFNHNKEKIRKSIEQQTQNIQKFQAYVQQLLHQHCQIKKKITQVKNVKKKDYQNYKQNSLFTYNNIRDKFSELLVKRRSNDQKFNLVIKQIINASRRIQKQDQEQLEQKEQSKYQILKTINPQKQIFSLIKENQFYNVIFLQIIHPQKKVISSINHEECEKALKIISHKAQNAKSKKRLDIQSYSCLPCRPNRTHIHNIQQTFICSILNTSPKVKGILTVNKQNIHFINNYGLFKKKVELLINLKDLKRLKQQEITQNGHNVIIIQTKYGEIKIESQSMALFQNLKGKIKFSQSSIIAIKRDSSGEFHNSYKAFTAKTEKTTQNGLELKRSSLKKQTLQQFKKMKNQIEKQIFFSKKLEVLSKVFKKETQRIHYLYNSQFLNFEVNQQKTVSLEKDNSILILFSWKVRFVKSDLLNSFQHSQSVQIKSYEDSIKVEITQKYHDTNKFYTKSFFNQIDKMNQQIINFINISSSRRVDVNYALQPHISQLKQEVTINQIVPDPFQVYLSQRRSSLIPSQNKNIIGLLNQNLSKQK